MKISIIGSGHVGATLGMGWANRVYEIMFGVRHLESTTTQELLYYRTYAATLWIGTTTGGLPLQNAISGCFA